MDIEDIHLLADTISSLEKCNTAIRTRVAVPTRETLTKCLNTIKALETAKDALSAFLSDDVICGVQDAEKQD